jgi:hypothetical protein
MVFYTMPIFIGCAVYISHIKLEKDVYSVSITFFGIFLALLLNLQVAIFAIFQRKWNLPKDSRLKEIQKDTIQKRRELLSDLNANVSYLTMMSCINLVIMLFFYIYHTGTGWISAFTIALYVHFLLTLLMIIKRSHALFQKEYCDTF